MLKFLNQHPELAIWVIGVLLTIISVLFGLVVKYFKDILEKAKEHGAAISKTNYTILQLREEQTKYSSSVHTAQKGIWEELIELRRSLVETNMVIGRRKEEVNQIRDDLRRFNNRLAEYRSLQKQFFVSIKNRKAEIDILKSTTLQITEDLKIIKSRKD